MPKNKASKLSQESLIISEHNDKGTKETLPRRSKRRLINSQNQGNAASKKEEPANSKSDKMEITKASQSKKKAANAIKPKYQAPFTGCGYPNLPSSSDNPYSLDSSTSVGSKSSQSPKRSTSYSPYTQIVPSLDSSTSVGSKSSETTTVASGSIETKSDTGLEDTNGERLPMADQPTMMNLDLPNVELVNLESNEDEMQMQYGILASLNLPSALKDTSVFSLPSSLQHKARNMREKGGLEAVETLIKELPTMLMTNIEILDECERMLKDEEDSDTELHSKFSTEWVRTPSGELNMPLKNNLQNYREIMFTANDDDQRVKEKYYKHRDKIAHLCLPEEAPKPEFLEEKNSGSANQREALLCDLAAAHNAFLELLGNLQERSDYYTSLTDELLDFQNKITDFCFARKTEKEDLYVAMAPLAPPHQNASPPPPEATDSASTSNPHIWEYQPPPSEQQPAAQQEYQTPYPPAASSYNPYGQIVMPPFPPASSRNHKPTATISAVNIQQNQQTLEAAQEQQLKERKKKIHHLEKLQQELAHQQRIQMQQVDQQQSDNPQSRNLLQQQVPLTSPCKKFKPNDPDLQCAGTSTARDTLTETGKPSNTLDYKETGEKPEEKILCKICFIQELDIVFQPCLHMVTCHGCAQALRECPICRKRVKKKLKVYI